jgi:hypothetical protein
MHSIETPVFLKDFRNGLLDVGSLGNIRIVCRALIAETFRGLFCILEIPVKDCDGSPFTRIGDRAFPANPTCTAG